MSSYVQHIKNSAAYGLASGLGATLVAGVSTAIGHNWLLVSSLHASGFGLVAGSTVYVASQVLKNWSYNIPSFIIGGAVAYGALELIAAPIAVPTAIILTTASVASLYLYKFIFKNLEDQAVTAAKDALAKTREKLNTAEARAEQAKNNVLDAEKQLAVAVEDEAQYAAEKALAHVQNLAEKARHECDAARDAVKNAVITADKAVSEVKKKAKPYELQLQEASAL